MSYNLTGAAQGGNFVLSRLGTTTLNFVIGGAATTHSTQALVYSVKGLLYYAAAGSGAATPTTDIATGLAFKPVGANQACVFVFGKNAAGATVAAQGKIVPYTDTSAGSTSTPLPIMPDTVAPIGYCVVKGGATNVTAWLLGTNNFTGVTGVTVDTGVDLFSVPTVDPVTA